MSLSTTVVPRPLQSRYLPHPQARQPATAARPLPRSKADILVELTRGDFTLEPFKLSVPIPGVTSYRMKGAPGGIGFRDHDAKLFSVEAMTLPGTPGMTDEMIVGLRREVTIRHLPHAKDVVDQFVRAGNLHLSVITGHQLGEDEITDVFVQKLHGDCGRCDIEAAGMP